MIFAMEFRKSEFGFDMSLLTNKLILDPASRRQFFAMAQKNWPERAHCLNPASLR
jgi:hypothetical protein